MRLEEQLQASAPQIAHVISHWYRAPKKQGHQKGLKVLAACSGWVCTRDAAGVGGGWKHPLRCEFTHLRHRRRTWQ